jgi:hypothetical protein
MNFRRQRVNRVLAARIEESPGTRAVRRELNRR